MVDVQTFYRFWDRCHPSLHRHCCRNTMAASLGPCFFRHFYFPSWSRTGSVVYLCRLSELCGSWSYLPVFTTFFTFKGIYPIGMTSWLFVLCVAVSTQSPIISSQIVLYVHLTIKRRKFSATSDCYGTKRKTALPNVERGKRLFLIWSGHWPWTSKIVLPWCSPLHLSEGKGTNYFWNFQIFPWKFCKNPQIT